MSNWLTALSLRDLCPLGVDSSALKIEQSGCYTPRIELQPTNRICWNSHELCHASLSEEYSYSLLHFQEYGGKLTTINIEVVEG
jgi:hypothetical protein